MEATWVLLLIFLSCDGFNIDVNKAITFSGNPDEFFGYRVLQYQNKTMKQIIVSAPLGSNTTGSIYSCSENKDCWLIYTPEKEEHSDIRFFGMSLAVSSSSSSPILTSCSPSLTHECDGNSYLNSICYKFTTELNPPSTFKPAFQDCTKGNVNLIFLFDGSSSMLETEFNMNKVFIWNIIKNLKNTYIQFAAVQFSKEVRTVFTFEDYVKDNVKGKLDKETFMRSLTNTHKALNFTLTHLFDNVTAGADPDATKALVIITDGAPSDIDGGELNRSNELNIQRFIIGVGKVKLDKLHALASEPKENNTFYIQNYNGLKGLLDNLQNKIYSIKGSQRGSKRVREKELSQTGFSAAFSEDSLILGAVGSNNWRGLLYEVKIFEENPQETEILDPDLKEDSYQGYSAAVGQKEKVHLVFSGAPRSDHRGQVTLYSKRNHKWEVSSRVFGEQIGSYFGSSVCVLDLDSDGETDFLLVGAPQYYQAHPQREGRLYVYSVSPELQVEQVLNIGESFDGRFAATLASIADLNGDKLQDLAVGAPQEDDGKGAIYIYLGKSMYGIRPQYTQRIIARTISEKLQQFGVAIDGGMDMEQDGIPDIAVGAQGVVIILKGRPVLSVSADLSFSPSEINLNNFDSLDKEATFPVVDITICFSVSESTNSTAEIAELSLNVSYELNSDALRKESRGFFITEEKKSKNLQKYKVLPSGDSCFNHTLYMNSSVTDTLSPILVQLSFIQSDQQPQRSVLNIDSRPNTSVEVPFQRNCKNTTCVAELELNFSFKNRTLVVVDQDYFIITVTLLNKGDDSFNTSLLLYYPEGLSLARFHTIQANKRTRSSCGDRDNGARNKTTCSISLPVYRQNTNAEFQGTFRISQSYNWAERMDMIIEARSDNNINTSNAVVRKSLPVYYAVNLSIGPHMGQSGKKYLNFSINDRGPKDIVIVFVVRNMGMKGLPVRVQFTVPSQIEQNFSFKDHSVTVQPNITECSKKLTSNSSVCSSGNCVQFECSSFFLEHSSEVNFNLTALAVFMNPKNYTEWGYFQESRMENVFSVSAQLDFNKQRYHQITDAGERDNSKFHRAKFSVRVELVIPPHMWTICGTGGGGGFILLILFIVLLIECGFFKRKHPEEQMNSMSSEPDPELTENKETPSEKSALVSSSEDPRGSENGETVVGEGKNDVSTEK